MGHRSSFSLQENGLKFTLNWEGTMDPTYFTGVVHKESAAEAIAEYWEYKPSVVVNGYGVLTQATVHILDCEPVSLFDAPEYAKSQCGPFRPAVLVPVLSNNNKVFWVWGVWLAAPDDGCQTESED
jgi:hypothetical protein